MDNNTMEILKLVASFLTPLILLIFGVLLNKKLETSKSTIAKQKGWQEFWAARFIEVAQDYNAAVSDCAVGFSQFCQMSHEKLPGWEDDMKQKECDINLTIWKLQYLNWQIQDFIQFAAQRGSDVKDKEKRLFDLLANLIGKKQGNLEEIRDAQFEFNEAVRLAHAEILEIFPGAAFRQILPPSDRSG